MNENVFKSNKLDKNATVQMEGRREVVRDVDYYNLDMIISLGYRVHSIQATKFRQWATKVLKSYLIDGYALNQKKLQRTKLKELETTLNLIRQTMSQKELSTYEAKGFVEIVSSYAKSWALLQGYLFVLFLHKNGILYKTNSEAKINDNALASLALLVATSAPEQKDIIIKLVMNILVEEF
ncbi:MAG: virulence RhuM family protein [Sulfurovum sp.]|nr:virulence RhuM family protein [Sulfurovum sp.]